MTRQIEEAMAKDIDSLDWMSPETKKRALEKLQAIVNKIGYPDKWRDYSAHHQSSRRLSSATWCARDISKSKRQLAKIGKPLDRSEWGMTPPTVNAYYNPQMNDINFPAGVLQPPLFDPKMDDAPNYGNTGAHHRPRADARLRRRRPPVRRQGQPEGLVDEEGRRGVREARAVHRRPVRAVHGGRRHQDQQQADARRRRGRPRRPDARLDGVEDADGNDAAASRASLRDGLTPEQRFFVGNAQWACENERPENLRVNALTDPHSPGKYRVNGVVVNMPEFQKAFSCKAGQPMVAEKRCRVW